MEMDCPPLEFIGKRRPGDLSDLAMADSLAASCIDDPRVLSTDDDLHSLIYDCWELRIEMSPNPGNEEASGKIIRFHGTLVGESAILWLPFVLF